MKRLFILLFAVGVFPAATQCCEAPKCDFVCDCSSCEDEQDCGHTGEAFVCDFELGECGWTGGSPEAAYRWERRQRGDVFTDTGPSSDYTTGTATGWFMAVTAVESKEVHTAVLVSPELQQTAPTCQISLRYFIWDSGRTDLGPAPLWASVRYPDGGEEAVLWRPEPSSVRGWREATVFVGRIPSTFRLAFYSDRQHGRSADVALDQLHFQHCALPPPESSCSSGMLQCSNGACVEQRLKCDGTDDCGDLSDELNCEAYHRCDFDEDLCDMWDLRTFSNLTWVRTNQNNISRSDPMRGPGRDHSNNTASGHFLYVTVPESGLINDWAVFQTDLLAPTNDSNPCKMVMYTHQFGPRSGGLTVLVAGRSIYPVWERGGALGDLWVRAEVDIVYNSNFQILIMAAIRNFSYGGIGVDTIVLSPECRLSEGKPSWPTFPNPPPHPCTSPERMCDFRVDCEAAKDEDTCGSFVYPEGHKGWTDTSIGTQGWLRHGTSTSKEVLLLVAEAAGRQETPAQMKTPLLGPSGPACALSFDFALTGSPQHIGELSVRVLDSVFGPQPTVWEFAGKTGTSPESWNHTDVHIGHRKSRFQLVFEGRAAEVHTLSQIRVTNITFRDCAPDYFPFTQTGVSCNFEEGLCGWFQDNSDNFDWTLLNGSDHTISVGRSLVVDMWSSTLRGAYGRLVSYPQPASTTGMCLSFFYKLYGPNTGTLNVKLLDDHGYELTLWSRTGAHGNMWHEAHCPVPHQYTPYRLMFEAVRSGFDGRVAIDDVAFSDKPCVSGPRMCSFEGTKCDFSSSGAVHWRLTDGYTSPNGPKTDHTLETPMGFYMLLTSDLLLTGGVSSLTSPLMYGTTHTNCLQFWYNMGGVSPGSLSVYLKPVKGERLKIFSDHLNQGAVWRHGGGDLAPGLVDWQLEFEVIGAGGKNSYVAIDDISILTHPCESQDSKCSLERGLCAWSNTQDPLKDQLDWELTSRKAETHYPAPDADHTTGHEEGHFLFLPSSDRTAANQNAWLLSPHLPPTKGTCLKFWANMPFSGVSELKVLLRSGGKNSELLSTSQTGESWRRFDANISSAQEYQIVFEGFKGPSGFLALDDMEYTVGVDCTGRNTDTVKKRGQINAGGIAALTIVVLLLVSTLMALLVYSLRSKLPSAGSDGFVNESYEPGLTEDHISFPPAQTPPMAARFSSLSNSEALD